MSDVSDFYIENKKLFLENYKLKKQVVSLNSNLSVQKVKLKQICEKYKFLLGKSAKDGRCLKYLSEKIDFYLDLPVNSEFDKGFFMAFEIMKTCLNQKFEKGEL